MEKYAIRIATINSNKRKIEKLFAVARDANHVIELRWMAKKTIPFGSSDWVTVIPWNSEFIN